MEEEWTPPGSRACKRSGWVSRGRGLPLFFQCRAHRSSGMGRCMDNIFIERLWRSLKSVAHRGRKTPRFSASVLPRRLPTETSLGGAPTRGGRGGGKIWGPERTSGVAGKACTLSGVVSPCGYVACLGSSQVGATERSADPKRGPLGDRAYEVWTPQNSRRLTTAAWVSRGRS